MILRKPYAFLIKHFRMIHIILTILMFVFFQKIREVVDFFNYYLDLNTLENITGVVKENYSVWYLLLPIIIIAFIIVVMWLLITKEKPVKYYITSIIVYILELIGMILAYVFLITIQQGKPDLTILTIFRDFLDLLSYIPIPIIIISLARGVGFNIKQFNFKKDMMELNIVDEDNEEFELEVNVDTEDIKAKFNRKKRFIKYVYLENKKIFWFLGTISFIIVGVISYFLIFGTEKIYQKNEVFQSYGVNVKLNESYKTKYTATGKIINKDKFYIIVSLNVNNTKEEETKLPYNKIYLRVNDDMKYSPIDNYNNYFNEFGIRYVSYDSLKKLENKNIILVYEIDNKYENNDYHLEYLVDMNDEKSENYKYAKIKIDPIKYDEQEVSEVKKIGETLIFNDNFLKNTEINITEIDFNSRYTHKYKQIVGGVEQEFVKTIMPVQDEIYNKIVMRLKVDLKKNKNLNPKIYSSIFEQFVTIEYEKEGKILIQKPDIIDLTPVNSEYVYLEVVYPVSNSKKTSLIFNIREKKYKYELVKKEEI